VAGQDQNFEATGGAVVQEDSNDPWIGQTLGSYQILKRIGHGGMGVIYLARHQSLDRLDAIKFLPEQFAQDAAYIELFFREAKAAARLSHPNIVAVHDAGSYQGIYYFVMDFVEGRDLGTVLKERGVLSVPEAVAYVRQAAQALGYANKKGIVHRDVKPENLLLTSEGVIKVADLGLAKWMGDVDGTFTQGEWVLGSPIYISPERLKDPHFNDPRMDIYSLGATFYHLVTGKIPYQGSSPVIMSQHLTAPVPDPTESNPIIESRIGAIIRKMLAKELGDRYQTMEEVDAVLADYELSKTRPSVPVPFKSPIAPTKTTNGSGQQSGKKTALLISIIVVLLSVAAYLMMHSPSQPEPTGKAPVSTPGAGTTAPIAVGTSLLLSDFNQSPADFKAKQLFDVQTIASQCDSRVDPGAGFEGSGGWRIDYDISGKDATARVSLKLPNVDATPYKDLVFRIRSPSGLFNLPVELTVGPSLRRYMIQDVGAEWKMVRIPLKSLSFPSLSPLTEFTVVFERQTTSVKQGTLLIDDIMLSRD